MTFSRPLQVNLPAARVMVWVLTIALLIGQVLANPTDAYREPAIGEKIDTWATVGLLVLGAGLACFVPIFR